jgi:aspartyl-tRNA(Asn)/glutamyl-tRNA(Gln) amidotransferase subunit A
VRERLEAAERMTLDDYRSATRAREAIRARFGRLFLQADLLLTCTPACGPPAPGVDTIDHEGAPRPVRQVIMTSTVPQNLVGLPACSVPFGVDDDGLPVGVQVTGPAWSDALVLAAAQALAEVAPLPRRPPTPPTPPRGTPPAPG